MKEQELTNLEQSYFLMLGLAVNNNDLDLARSLLEKDIVKKVAVREENYLLRIAAENGHFEIVQELLKIDAVKADATAMENYALDMAVENGHLEVVQELLKIDAVKAIVAEEENYTLRIAVFKGHVEIVKELLKIDAVRATAAIDENSALISAAHNGHLSTVQELLKIDVVKKAVTARNNGAINYAVEKSHFEVVQALLAVPEVFDFLLRDDAQGLIRLYECSDESTRSFILSRPIYGICLDQIIDKKSETLLKDIQAYCVDPKSYLEGATNYSLNKIQAVRLLNSELNVVNYERMQKEASRSMEYEQNPDDEGKIAVVLRHFEHVIKPAFRDEFESYGATNAECLANIESKIRALLLNRIVKDLQEQLQNENNSDEIQSIEERITFITTDFDQLKTGQNEKLMAQARDYFCSNKDNNQIAWRAYDKWAPCVKDWPNLLTPSLEASAGRVFTVGVLGEHDTTAASLRVRELVAYSFLLVNDENDGDDAIKLDRIENFIAQIKDVRRAHNLDDDEGMDNASCFPGSVGRVGTMWAMHSLALNKKMLELLPEIFRGIIAKKFSTALANCDTQEQKNDLYHSLIMLRKENAQEVINQQAEFADNPEWARKRDEFIDHLGSLKEIEQEVNLMLEEMRSEAKLTPDQHVYLFQYLADIGGRWFAEMLTSIYLQSVNEMEIETIKKPAEINNPFAINPMMRKMLSAARLEMREQSSVAWKKIFPILAKVFSDQEKCEELAKMIAEDWARSEKIVLPALAFSTFTQDRLEVVIMSPQEKNAIHNILQEYKNCLTVQVDKIDKLQSNNQQIKSDNKLNSENTLIFSETMLTKRTRNTENDYDNQLISSAKRIKNNSNQS